MSYRIKYGHENKKSSFWNGIHIPLAVLLLLIASVNVIHAVSGNLATVRNRLMPWTRQDVKEAYVSLCDDLAEGKSITESLEVFCNVILHPEEDNAEAN